MEGALSGRDSLWNWIFDGAGVSCCTSGTGPWPGRSAEIQLGGHRRNRAFDHTNSLSADKAGQQTAWFLPPAGVSETDPSGGSDLDAALRRIRLPSGQYAAGRFADYPFVSGI